MRFLHLSAMPASSVREWLDHELETRGIDAVVYTRYILSILQQDTFNFEPQERDLFPVGSKKRDPCVGKGKGLKSKQKVNTKMKFTDSEEMKKSAAVECLLSASEQTCGIEELVDELCSRLKSMQCEGYTNEPDSNAIAVEGKGPVKDSNVVQSSPEELAKMYYAAFPALSGQLHMQDELAGFSSYSMQYNTFWDGKKLLSTTTNDSQLRDEIKDSGKSISLRKIDGEGEVPQDSMAVFTVEEAERCQDVIASESKPAKLISKVPHIHYTHHHHHHHHHHQHHLAKIAKFGREQVGGKPSFIVPKCKYRMLKQRVPFFKGKSPFSAPELKLKRFVLSESKPNSRSPSERYFRSKKFDDFEIGYDSSFEDGDGEEIGVSSCLLEQKKNGAVSSARDSLEGSAPTPRDEEEEKSREKCENRAEDMHDSEPERGQDSDDVEILHKLEAKFNESLASIWSKQDMGDTPIDKLSQMLETAFKTSLSTWFTKLKKSDDDGDAFVVDLYTPGEMMAAMDYYLDTTSNEKAIHRSKTRVVAEAANGQQFLLQKLGSLWERTADPTDWGQCSPEDAFQQVIDPSRIWQCGSRKQNFIKGGVYGFEELQELDERRGGGLLGESDLYEISKKTSVSNSPAFDSDSESFVEDSRSSKLELNAIREDELKIIWEILGAIGGRDSEASLSDEGGEIPLLSEDARAKSIDGKNQGEDSIWEPLECYDLWDREQVSMSVSKWGYCSDADQSSALSELSLLWNGNFNVQAKEICAFGSDSNIINGTSASFCWGSAESYHQSFWDIWKEDNVNGTGCGMSIIEALVACNGGSTRNEHASMTRSYDSYLNRGVSEEVRRDNLSRAQDQPLHRSDPILFGRKSTLTYHKGESLFVEVKQRRSSSAALRGTNESLAASKNDNISGAAENACCDKREPSLRDRDANEDILEEENLLTSPKTHFRPIRLLSCDSDDDSASSCDAVAENASDEGAKTQGEVRGSDAAAVGCIVGSDGAVSPPSGKPIFTQDENGILHLSSENENGEHSCQLYMFYKGQEANGRKQEETAVSAFVPKFKLRPDLEKFCQTEDAEAVREASFRGTAVGDAMTETRRRLNGEAFERGDSKAREVEFSTAQQIRNEGIAHLYRISSAFKDLIEEDDDDDDDDDNDDVDLGNCGSAAEPKYSFTNLGKDFGCIAGFRPSELDLKKFEGVSSSLWSAGDDDDSSGINGDDSSWPTNSEYNGVNDLDEQDFWAISERVEKAESGGLMSMKEEIKQEEEELFDDINQMRELDLHYVWNEGCEGWSPTGLHNIDKRDDGLEWPSRDSLYQEVMLECQEDEDCPELEMINGRRRALMQRDLMSPWDQNLEDDRWGRDDKEAAEDGENVCLKLKSFKAQDASDPGTGKHHQLSLIPTGKVVYSSDLEEEWMKHGKPFDIQVPKRHFLKAKLRSQRRPCTFYMDGNCRRTDCKFSHDLASITCRFWEEGSCFKGITCPFLHGYPRKHSPLHASSKAKDFHLESESDFPSLSKSVDSTSSGSWMASAFSVKRKRKRNRPRHHSSSTMEADSVKCKIFESDKA